jgi:hypothetical protein
VFTANNISYQIIIPNINSKLPRTLNKLFASLLSLGSVSASSLNERRADLN